MKIALRLNLAFVCTVLSISIACVSFIPTFLLGLDSVDKTVFSLRQAVRSNMDGRISSFIQSPARLNQDIALQHQLGSIGPQSRDSWRRWCFRTLVSHPEVNFIVFATLENGLMYGCEVLSNATTGEPLFYWHLRDAQSSNFTGRWTYLVNGSSSVYPILSPVQFRAGYDPRKRSWWTAGLNEANNTFSSKSTGVWTDPYLVSDGTKISMTNIVKLVNETTGELWGMVTLDAIISFVNSDAIVAETVSTFLSHIPVGKTGNSFIINVFDGTVVGTSWNEPLVVSNSSTLKRVEELDGYNQIMEQLGGTSDSVKNHPRGMFTLNGYWISTSDWKADGNLHWLAVSFIPDSDFLSDIRDLRTIILPIMAAVFLSILIGVVWGLQRMVALPLEYFAESMTHVSVMNLEAVKPPPNSFVSEVESMRQSFETMINAIKDYRAFIPDAIFVKDSEMSTPSNPSIVTVESATTSSDSPLSTHLTGRAGSIPGGLMEVPSLMIPASSPPLMSNDLMFTPTSNPLNLDPKAGSFSLLDSTASQGQYSRVQRLCDSGFRPFKASLLCVENPFLDHIGVKDASEYYEESVRFLSSVMEVVERHDGVLHMIQPDHIICTFNCFKANPNHETSVCSAALELSSQYKMVVFGGMVLVGFLGTKKRRSPVILGTCMQDLPDLLRLSRHIVSQVLVTGPIAQKARDSQKFVLVSVDRVRVKDVDLDVYELLSVYTPIPQKLIENISNLYTMAFSDFLNHDYINARNRFQTFLDEDPDCTTFVLVDHIIRLMRLCEYFKTLEGTPSAPPNPYYRAKIGPWIMYEGDCKDVIVEVDVTRSHSILDNSILSPTKSLTENCSDEQQQLRDILMNSGKGLTSPRTPDDPTLPLPSFGQHFAMEIVDMAGVAYKRSDRRLGTGATASVWLGMQESDGSLVAMKALKLPNYEEIEVVSNTPKSRRRQVAAKTQKSKKDVLEELISEVTLMLSLRHDNVVAYLGSAVVQDYLVVITEYVSGGSLHAAMYHFGKLPLASVRRYIRDVLHGLGYLHQNNIIHRDIKPHNVLLMIDGQCKLTDFGAAAQLSKESSGSAVVGTAVYMSPEACRGNPTKASDVWAVGIMTAELLTGRVPFNPAMLDNFLAARFIYQMGHLVEGILPEVPSEASCYGSATACDFIRQCLVVEEGSRPNVRTLLSHAFLL